MPRHFYRRRARRRGRFEWLRDTFNNVGPVAVNNIDLMQFYRSHMGINVNLPEISIWRVRLKISVSISIPSGHTFSSNDGVLATVFVDGQNQVLLSQMTNSFDERDMLYDFMYCYDTLKSSTDETYSTSCVIYKEFDIKSHRALRSVDDTLFLQLAASGQAQIDDYSVSAVTLIKVGR